MDERERGGGGGVGEGRRQRSGKGEGSGGEGEKEKLKGKTPPVYIHVCTSTHCDMCTHIQCVHVQNICAYNPLQQYIIKCTYEKEFILCFNKLNTT